LFIYTRGCIRFVSMRIFISSLLVFVMAACTAVDPEKAVLVLKPAGYGDLPGWQADRHEEALVAFAKSCERILKRNPSDAFGPDGVGGTYGDWQPACRALPGVKPEQAR